ncbi:UDP-glucose/GDP-mannose dehydrogenase family protein [Cupriavidus gilardii]|uniref:UDP-glucose dehydrogenase family protein n=1 Tax=Cupriavidus gilardii TaxID=82541 RepID=UPI00157492F1|nr:UDP-glucose/GDP-mannose dehydrogenase family protein [Cupriavidus gilardii]MCG5260136.1 UDP-glucose/GDP-mannose dehydrogenase family protein [Cupriavidus gilardii]MDF9429460.1 UDP-glucose/GDP-mannose dehydrogenase family protein [Cupriavidus gilardii]NSX05143.1 UDP-glucose/GDP-mannose dehydrogenase family protein [Cupriavidus gilardii]
MKVTIIGSGYVGLVTGACLAELGNDVFCLDVDEEKIALLNDGGVPIYEPGLKDLIQRNRDAGRLVFSTDVAAAVDHADVQFIAVGTPADEDGSADLQYVLAAARNIGRHMTGFKIVVDKSTVPVGTGDRVAAAIREELAARGLEDLQFSVVSNPEFLKEGAAVEDFMRPDRIVLGCNNDAAGRHAKAIMRQLYAPFNRNHERTFYMDVRSAEFTKYAANSMLATRISFMNELANLADEVGADIELVRLGIGSDPRIGYSFLYAGAGYGGSCFPKDVQALMRTAASSGKPMRVLEAVEAVNEAQKRVLGDKVVRRFGEDLSGRTFAIWGLAFKPNTDDMREAPSRVLARDLVSRGASLRVHDPVAMHEARRALAQDLAEIEGGFERVTFCEAQMETLDGADALAIVTEWKVFRSPDFAQIRRRLKTPVVFDGRNLYEPAAMQEAGIEYHAIGRPAAAA